METRARLNNINGQRAKRRRRRSSSNKRVTVSGLSSQPKAVNDDEKYDEDSAPPRVPRRSARNVAVRRSRNRKQPRRAAPLAKRACEASAARRLLVKQAAEADRTNMECQEDVDDQPNGDADVDVEEDEEDKEDDEDDEEYDKEDETMACAASAARKFLAEQAAEKDRTNADKDDGDDNGDDEDKEDGEDEYHKEDDETIDCDITGGMIRNCREDSDEEFVETKVVEEITDLKTKKNRHHPLLGVVDSMMKGSMYLHCSCGHVRLVENKWQSKLREGHGTGFVDQLQPCPDALYRRTNSFKKMNIHIKKCTARVPGGRAEEYMLPPFFRRTYNNKPLALKRVRIVQYSVAQHKNLT
jgi:hypothetical protein